MPSVTSLKPFRRLCTLWVHDDAFSPHCILFNSELLPEGSSRDGRVLKIVSSRETPERRDHHSRKGTPTDIVKLGDSRKSYGRRDDFGEPTTQPCVFVARNLEQPEQSRLRNLQVSVCKDVANVHGFHNRMSVWVEDAIEDQFAASYVELNFSDPLNRADLWKTTISELSRRRCVYQGQELSFLNSIKVIVKKLFVAGRRVPSALFSKTSRPIFRSTAARFIFGIQVSKEMFEFDDELSNSVQWSKAMDFIFSLLERWSIKKTNHMLSIMLFTRLQTTEVSPGSQSDTTDLYRVVASDVPVSDSLKILRDIHKTYRGFVNDIRRHETSHVRESTPASAMEGNLLEAINVAVSACWLDDLDLDFVRTGTSIVMLSPSSGVFNVNENLLRVTGERLMSRSIGVELVCLSAPPLNAIPLFVLNRNHDQQSSEKDLDGRETDRGLGGVHNMPEKSLSLQQTLFVLPSWVETSFYYGPSSQRSVGDMKQFSQTHQLSGLVKEDTRNLLETHRKCTSDLNHDQLMVRNNLALPDARKSIEPSANLDNIDKHIFAVKFTAEYSTPRQHKVFDPLPQPSLSASRNNSPIPARQISRNRAISAIEPPTKPATGSRLTSTLGRATIGKAGAVTGSSSDLASPIQHRQTTTEDSIVPKSVHSLFQASLSRMASASIIATPDTRSSSDHDNASSASKLSSTSSSPSTAEDFSSDAAIPETNPSDQKTKNSQIKARHDARPRLSSLNYPPESLPWLVIRNPCNTNHIAVDAFGEWTHAFTSENRVHAVKWKALCSPASLPLTTEHFPSSSELNTTFEMNPYKVSLNNPDPGDQNLARRRGQLAREMVLHRISDGFQIAVGPMADKIIGASAANPSDFYADDFLTSDGAAVMMLKGESIQLLCASGDEVSVTRYKRKKVLPEATTYTARVRTFLDLRYNSRQLSFSLTPDRNWSKIDNEIADAEADSYERQMTMPTTISNPRRARFVLIPVEPSSSLRQSHPASDESDEEIRLEGIRKLTMLWQKNRWIPPEEERNYASWIGHKDINPLAIEYQTRDPSAVVAAGFESSILTEGESTAAMTQLFNEKEAYRTSHVDLQRLAADLQSERGIGVRSRRWRFRIYEHCFVGHDLTSFLLGRFQDIKTREEAVEFGSVLMQRGLFQHVHKKHRFRDGNYFYTIAPDHRTSQNESKSNWFSMRKALTSVPSTPFTEGPKEFPDPSVALARGFPSKKPKVSLSGSIQYNVDPKKVSTRPEIITIHYDRLHNPDNSFHFLLEWTNATARLVEDSLTSWAGTVARYGLKLIQVPIAEICSFSDVNPLRSPYPIEMVVKTPGLPPRSVTESPLLKPQQISSAKHFQKELLKRFDFILDHEAISSFPADVDVGWSWGQLEYHHDQYVHRSGVLLAQIVDDWKFILLANRLYNNRVGSLREQLATRERDGDAARSKGSNIPRQTSAAALSAVTNTNLSPVMSPLYQQQSRSEYVTPHESRRTSSNNPRLSAEELKDGLEAFCNSADSLRAFYEDVLRQLTEKPTPALSALSVAPTPSLLATVPSLDLPGEGDEDSSLTAL